MTKKEMKYQLISRIKELAPNLKISDLQALDKLDVDELVEVVGDYVKAGVINESELSKIVSWAKELLPLANMLIGLAGIGKIK